MSNNTEIKIVTVSKFRGIITHLERIYHVHRSACVGKSEKEQNSKIMTRIRNELLNTDCKRKKPEDVERYEKIINITGDYLGFDSLTNTAFSDICKELGLSDDDIFNEGEAIATLALARGAGVSDEKYQHLLNEQIIILSKNAETKK